MKGVFARWLREPLLHFLLLGLGLFALLPNGTDESSREIKVGRAQLIEFMQGRARIYDGRSFSNAYAAMTPTERAELQAAFVRQEALFREAKHNRLDEADPVIRQRLVQQMDLLLRDEAGVGVNVSAADVDAYFARHQEDYRRPASASFTHVFFDRSKHGAGAESIAEKTLSQLRSGSVSADRAIEYGDRFAYQRNYADATAAALVPEVGATMAKAVFTSPLRSWQGPFPSPLGLHLVFIDRRQAPETPQLAAIRTQVTQDALLSKRNQQSEEAIRRVLASYRVVGSADLGKLADAPR